MTGPALALLTWALGLAVLALAGAGPATIALRRAPWPVVARHGLWWGGALATASVLAASLVAPLASGRAAAIVGGTLAIATTAGVLALRGRAGREASLPWWPVLTAAVAAALALAVAAGGRVTNYDTGLYHLGAIAYAREFGTVPGLANLYFGLGYSNAEFPLAAFLGNGPWGAEGYRLLNALVVLAYVADVLLRLMAPRRGPGTFIAAIGLGVVLVPMLGLADYWVVSPTSDSPVFVLTFVALAALADALTGRRPGPDAALAVVAMTLACAMRPTMLPMAALVAGAGIVVAVRARQRRAIALAAALAAVIGAEQALRDRILSGWLQYPLSLLPFDVPWRAADPVAARAATLGTARDPERLWQAAGGWDWIGPWLRGLPGQWETWLIACLAAAVLIACALARGRVRRPKALLAAMFPPAAMTVTWFLVTPPAFRFGWGPVFGTLVVLLAWCCWSLPAPAHALRVLLAGSSALVVASAVFATATRSEPWARTQQASWTLGPVGIPYRVAPVREVPTGEVPAQGGLRILVPEGTDQCWSAFPLCTPEPSSGLRPLGPSLADGLTIGG